MVKEDENVVTMYELNIASIKYDVDTKTKTYLFDVDKKIVYYEDLHKFHLDLVLVAYFKNNADFCV